MGAPKGSTIPPPRDAGRYNLPYGVVYDCPVNPGVCDGLVASGPAGERLYDSRGM